jgi:hypothetical protein
MSFGRDIRHEGTTFFTFLNLSIKSFFQWIILLFIFYHTKDQSMQYLRSFPFIRIPAHGTIQVSPGQCYRWEKDHLMIGLMVVLHRRNRYCMLWKSRTNVTVKDSELKRGCCLYCKWKQIWGSYIAFISDIISGQDDTRYSLNFGFRQNSLQTYF